MMGGLQPTRIDVIDRMHEIRRANIDTTDVSPLSRVYENLPLKIGKRGINGGRSFMPRQVIAEGCKLRHSI